MTLGDAETQAIDCPTCELMVSARVKSHLSYYVAEEMNEPIYLFLLECPGCKLPMAGTADIIQTDLNEWKMSSLSRVWPEPKKLTSWTLPDLMRTSIEEATRCLDARAYNACVVMCGRAIEALCKEYVVKGSLMSGLKELKQKGIIDGRLYEWGEALREARNIGAHATEFQTSRENARDVLDFTDAIGEYVYVLTYKYKQFIERKAKKIQKVELI